MITAAVMKGLKKIASKNFIWAHEHWKFVKTSKIKDDVIFCRHDLMIKPFSGYIWMGIDVAFGNRLNRPTSWGLGWINDPPFSPSPKKTPRYRLLEKPPGKYCFRKATWGLGLPVRYSSRMLLVFLVSVILCLVLFSVMLTSLFYAFFKRFVNKRDTYQRWMKI